MLTKQQRLAAVPELLNAFDDDAIDATTRGWVYGALRLITGAELGKMLTRGASGGQTATRPRTGIASITPASCTPKACHLTRRSSTTSHNGAFRGSKLRHDGTFGLNPGPLKRVFRSTCNPSPTPHCA